MSCPKSQTLTLRSQIRATNMLSFHALQWDKNLFKISMHFKHTYFNFRFAGIANVKYLNFKRICTSNDTFVLKLYYLQKYHTSISNKNAVRTRDACGPDFLGPHPPRHAYIVSGQPENTRSPRIKKLLIWPATARINVKSDQKCLHSINCYDGYFQNCFHCTVKCTSFLLIDEISKQHF